MSDEKKKEYKYKNYNEKCLANLKSYTKGDPRASINGRKGFEKKMENLRKKKAMKKVLTEIMELGVQKGTKVTPEEVQSMVELENSNVDIQTAILMAMVGQAMSGDVKAATFVRDTLGEKPKEEIDVSANIAAANKLTSIMDQLSDGGEELEEIDDDFEDENGVEDNE